MFLDDDDDTVTIIMRIWDDQYNTRSEWELVRVEVVKKYQSNELPHTSGNARGVSTLRQSDFVELNFKIKQKCSNFDEFFDLGKFITINTKNLDWTSQNTIFADQFNQKDWN